METTVVNIKVKYIRPEYQDLKEWCSDPNNVYIGRKRIVFIDGERYPKCDSLFANPYKGENAIEKYRDYLLRSMKNGDITEEDVRSLRGKKLGCWCKPDRCHGDVILDVLKTLENN